MQLHLQAVRIYQVDAKARSGDMTSKHNVTLAHQRSEKREKKKTEMARCKKIKNKKRLHSRSSSASGSHMWGLAVKLPE